MTTTGQVEPQREMLSLVTARVRDAYVRKPFYVDGELDLVSVCRELAAHALTHALVRESRDGAERLGIFTTTDLRDALLRPEPPASLAVREVARFDRGRGAGRRRAVRGLVADGAPPRTPPGGARR
jgi:CBS domain-containing protein